MSKTQTFAVIFCLIVAAVSSASSAPAADKHLDSIDKTSGLPTDKKPDTPVDNDAQHSDIETIDTDRKGSKLSPKPVKDKDFYIQAMVQSYQSRPPPMMAPYNNGQYEHGGYGSPMQYGGGYGSPMQYGGGYGYDSSSGFNMHGRNNEYGNSWY